MAVNASKPLLRQLGLLAVLFGAIPAALTLIGGGYPFQVGITALIFVTLAVSLNLVTGTAGLLSLGHAGFFGVGAYAAALTATKLHWPFLLTLPFAGLVAAALGVIVALPTMRLISIYFAVATLGVGEMIHVSLLNWVSFTRGPMGIRSIPPIEILGFDLSGVVGGYYVAAVVAALAIFAVHRLTHSYYGNALRSLREDDQCAAAMGLNPVRLKIEAFAVSCAIAGIAGAVYAHTASFISPDSFRFEESILILAMIVVGGLGSVPGAIVGSVLLIVLPEVLRGIGDFRMIAVGVFMFLSILFLPKGLLGEASAIGLARRQLGAAWRGDIGAGWK